MNKNLLSQSILGALMLGLSGYATQANAHAYYNAGSGVSVSATYLGNISSTPAYFSGTPGGKSFMDASTSHWDSDNTTDLHQNLADITKISGSEAYLGWTHNSRWARFEVNATTTVKITVSGSDSQFHPGFVLFQQMADTGGLNASTSTSYLPYHLYIQDKSANTSITATEWNTADGTSLQMELITSGYDSDLAGGGTFSLHNDLNDIALSDGNQGSLQKYVTLAAGTYFLGIGAAAEWSGTTQVIAANRTFNASVQAVPVPAAAWLFGGALMSLIGANRRKRVLPA